MKGWFEIERVPGNFHFSSHAYTDIIQQFLLEGGYRNYLNIKDKPIKLSI